jgi:hypothetical protein
LVPEGETFFYAHELLRRMWGEAPGNPDPPEPQAYRRLTPAEQDERDLVLLAELRRVDETLERSQALHAEGHEVAAVGLLKYVDLLLARFNLALWLKPKLGTLIGKRSCTTRTAMQASRHGLRRRS